MKSIKALFVVLLMAFVLTACSGGAASNAADTKTAGKAADGKGEGKSDNKGGARGGGRGGAPRNVKTVEAAARTLDQTVLVSGTLAAEQEIILGMKVAGRLSEVNVDLGTAVKKGAVVARLDPTDFDLRVRSAQAALEQALVRLGLPTDSTQTTIDPASLALARQAKADLEGARGRNERAKQLGERGLAAKADLDAADSAYRNAEAKYEDSLDEAQIGRAHV